MNGIVMKDTRLGAGLDKLLLGPQLRKAASSSTLASQRRPSTPSSDTTLNSKVIDVATGRSKGSSPASTSAMQRQSPAPLGHHQPCGLATPEDEGFSFNCTAADEAQPTPVTGEDLGSKRAPPSSPSPSPSSLRKESIGGGSESGSSTPRRRGRAAIRTLWRKCAPSKERDEVYHSPPRRPSNASSDATVETPGKDIRFTCSVMDASSDTDFFSSSVGESAFSRAPVSPRTKCKALVDEGSPSRPPQVAIRHGSLPESARPSSLTGNLRTSPVPRRIPHPLASPSSAHAATDGAAPCFRNPFTTSSHGNRKFSSDPSTPTVGPALRVRFTEETKPPSPRSRSSPSADCGCWPSASSPSSTGALHVCSSPDPFKRLGTNPLPRHRGSSGSSSLHVGQGERPSLAWAPKPTPPSPHIFAVPEEAEWHSFHDTDEDHGALGLSFGTDDEDGDDDDRLSCAFSDDSDVDAPSSVSSGMPFTPRKTRPPLQPILPADPFAAHPVAPMRVTSRSLSNAAAKARPDFSPLTPSLSNTSSTTTFTSGDSDALSITTAATSASDSSNPQWKPASADGPPRLPQICVSSLPSAFHGMSL